MSSCIKLYGRTASVVFPMGPLNFMSFPGGERHVRLPQPLGNEFVSWVIDARLYSAEGVMDLLLLTDALRRSSPGTPVKLVLPYVPYARQDRVALAGEALSAKVFCSLINAQGYSEVVIVDPHSDVVSALLDRVVVIPAAACLDALFKAVPQLTGCALVAPDAGARKRTEAAAQALGARVSAQVIYGAKHRDPATGHLSDFSVEGAVPDRPLLVVDDICDGGRTFVGLAKALRQKQSNPAQPLYLYVTHGLFTHGLGELKQHFEAIFSPVCRDLEKAAALWPSSARPYHI